MDSVPHIALWDVAGDLQTQTVLRHGFFFVFLFHFLNICRVLTTDCQVLIFLMNIKLNIWSIGISRGSCIDGIIQNVHYKRT